MKVSLTRLFRIEISTLLVMLALNKENVFSNQLTRMKHCRSTEENACVIFCKDWDLKSESRQLEGILKAEGKKFKTCVLILETCYQTNITWDRINPDENPKIVDLKIVNSLINLSELNLKIFKNIQILTLKNTTTTNLQLEVFRQLPNLQKLEIQRSNCIEWVEEGFLQNLTLNSLQVHGLTLNQSETTQFFKNLTGGRDIPKIRELDWSHNNFGSFTLDLLTHFPNLSTLNLTNSNILTFEGTFNHGNIKKIYINQNKIQNLPEKTFRPLVENALFVSLTENNLTCNCDMKWLQNLLKRTKCIKQFQITCAYPDGAEFLETDICPENKLENTKELHCTPTQNSETVAAYNFLFYEIRFLPNRDTSQKFSITNDKPELIEITISKTIDTNGIFLFYGNYANITFPQFNCLKIQQKISIYVTPKTNYLICLATISKHSQIDIFDCYPFKTRPPYEEEPLVTRKSIPLSILFISVVFLFALAFGALILYLSVCKNPSLIRRSKRVIEVKRHDKAQVLVMPRGYERVSQTDSSSLTVTNPRFSLEPSRSSLSCDTISTVSYVSAHQPTQLEILTYRLSRLRELFQWNNNLPTPMPMQISTPISQRLPPDVDLLFEYEWYTITTTTTTEQ